MSAQEAEFDAFVPAAPERRSRRLGRITAELEHLVNRAVSRDRRRVESVFSVFERLRGFDKAR